jgi:hypothetical protein
MRGVIIVCDACNNKWIPDMGKGEMVTPPVSISNSENDGLAVEIKELEDKLNLLKKAEPRVRPDGGDVKLGNKSYDLCGGCFNKIKAILRLPVPK